ncbi:MAG TPA: hypothetical protein VFC44_27550 [Candidatus Saccharimonadales bacterium]|nr:hypothetical protein [Candidatus Saccharimonadales bacterium]
MFVSCHNRRACATLLLSPLNRSGKFSSFQPGCWGSGCATVADTNGFVQFTDTNAPSFNYRFYHTVPQ